MIRTKYEQTKVADEPLYAQPENAGQVFSVEAADESGIFALGSGRYSKTYRLSDVNFAGVTEEEQKDLIISFSKVLKSIPCRFSYCIANEYMDEKKFLSSVLYKKTGSCDDRLRDSCNQVIREKLSEARQGLFQSIYLTLTIQAEDMKDARNDFSSIEGGIRSAFIGMSGSGMQGAVMQALSTDERMNLIGNFTHAGLFGRRPFYYEKAVSEGRDFGSMISPAAIEFDNESFLLNGRIGKVFYIDEYPKTLEADILTSLSRISTTSFVTVANELLDLSAFKQEISRKYMVVGMKIEGEKQRNRNNNDFLSDASSKLLHEKDKLDQFMKEIDTRDDHYFNTTILMLVLAKDKEELAVIEEKLKNAASLKSFTLKSCFARQREGMDSALPFGVQEFKKVVNLSSSCLAMFMPFRVQELFDEGGIYYGINQLSRNAIFGDKKRLKNHNGMILGQSGSGKSFFTKMEILGVYLGFEDDQILIVDPQSEYGPLIEKLCGTVICFDSAKEFYLNPMDVSFKDADYGMLREIIAQKSDFIITLVSSLLKRDLAPEEQGIIDKVIDQVYSENYSIQMRLCGKKAKESGFEVPGFMKKDESMITFSENMTEQEQVRNLSPTLLDVYQGLLDQGSDTAAHLAAALEIFVNGSLNLFNHRTNVDLDSRLIAFDLSGIKENLRTTGMLIMMETLREKVRNNSKSGVWTHVYVDEFHEVLAVDQVAAFVLKLWKEIRKMSGCLTGITQNMSDILSDENAGRLSAILSNTEYFALLSQSAVDKRKLMRFLPEVSPAMFNFVDNAPSGTGLLKMGNVTIPFDMRMRKDTEIYGIVNTDGGSYGV
ncbi:MAG: ATP-binding protein [Lachnospiraceae bacterium]|nr:ATP-binding protein [Lachnospiraceae bacterium]